MSFRETSSPVSTEEHGEKARAQILIPARNEAATIGQVVRGCRQAGFHVVVIDDASQDETARQAMEAGAMVWTVEGDHHGKTAALRLALKRLPDGIEWIFFMDGDGQHDPDDLERLWAARSEADLVVGNRFPDAARMPRLRRWTNCIMSDLLRQSAICDSQCGFRLVRRSWLGGWLPQGNHFQFETEMALLVSLTSCRAINLPIAATYGGERSKIVPSRDAVNFVQCLLRYQVSAVRRSVVQRVVKLTQSNRPFGRPTVIAHE